MDENKFWHMIEDAWREVSDSASPRSALAHGKLSAEDAESLAEQSSSEMVPALELMLEELPQEELLRFDRILEQKLYELDRAEIHEHTDGSDDGFLYCRAFIVAAGHTYYQAVNADPSRALMDIECEDLCYLPMRIYTKKFGEIPPSGISRETGSNKTGWPK